MKIPTTPPGGAPYYHGPPMNGMELNPPWQANGVIVEGAPSASNGSYMMPQQAHHHGVPPQPHHTMTNTVGGYMPQQQVPGGGTYYPHSEPEDSPTPPHNQDFSEYMWMENQEEFDKQVMQQLEEEALMEQCIEAMLADEEREGLGRPSEFNLEEQVSKSTLNPLAAEFVPSFLPSAGATGGSPSASLMVSNVEPPTESLKELSVSKSSPSDDSQAECQDDVEKSREAAISNNSNSSSDSSNVVVVSAKDVLTPKSSIDDSERPLSKSRERKDSEKKKGEVKKKAQSDISKKEKMAVAAVTAAVLSSKSSAKANVQRTRSQSGGDSKNKTESNGSKKQLPNSKKAMDRVDGPAPSKKPEIKVDDTVDLQGPPLPVLSVPVVSAISSTPAAEQEKQSTPPPPPVFNYAAAARANLPPKQPVQPSTQQVAPKETTSAPNVRVTPTPATVSTTSATKPQTTSSKTDSTFRPKSSKANEKAGDSKKATSKAPSGNSSKKGGKK